MKRGRGRPRGTGQEPDGFGEPRARATYQIPANPQTWTVTTFGVTRRVKASTSSGQAEHYRRHREDYRVTALDLAWQCRWAMDAGAAPDDVYAAVPKANGLSPATVKRRHQEQAKLEGWPKRRPGRRARK